MSSTVTLLTLEFFMAIVYQHIRLDTKEVFYIGIGKAIKRAFSKHDRNKYWCHIVNKVGYEAEIVHENLTWEEAQIEEIKLIARYGRMIRFR